MKLVCTLSTRVSSARARPQRVRVAAASACSTSAWFVSLWSGILFWITLNSLRAPLPEQTTIYSTHSSTMRCMGFYAPLVEGGGQSEFGLILKLY